MAGLVPAVHVSMQCPQDADARHIGERCDAVLRTAMAGDDGGLWSPNAQAATIYHRGRYGGTR